MGIKKVVKTVSVQEVIYRCDVCDKEISPPSACVMCRAILCRNHVVFDDRDFGDYPDQYCQKCWDAGDEYRKQIKKLRLECDTAVEALETAWRKQATER
jgi:hypothetical protein